MSRILEIASETKPASPRSVFSLKQLRDDKINVTINGYTVAWFDVDDDKIHMHLNNPNRPSILPEVPELETNRDGFPKLASYTTGA